MYRLVIFDFDGTLANSYPFFLGVFNRLADEHGFLRLDTTRAAEHRHGDIRQLMHKVAMSPRKLPAVANSFIALMQEQRANVPLFDNVNDTLRRLTQGRVALAIVSSNSYQNVTDILGPENMRHIKYVECGISVFGKAARLKKLLRIARVHQHHAIYIGDQLTDLEAARAAGIAFGAVAWGYASIESLRTQGPDLEFAKVSDLVQLIEESERKS